MHKKMSDEQKPTDFGRGAKGKGSAEERADEKLKRLNAELPASLHADFKAKAAKEGRKMTGVVRELIAEYLEE